MHKQFFLSDVFKKNSSATGVSYLWQHRTSFNNIVTTFSGLGGSSSSIRPPTDAQFVRPSTSTFPAPPPPYPASASPAAPAASGGSPAGGSGQPVALSSPLLVNLLQNDAPAPQPRAKLPPHPPLQHPAKLDRLDDGQVTKFLFA